MKTLDAAIATAAALLATLQAAREAALAPAQSNDDETLSLKECGPSVRTLRAAIAAGALPASLVGREYRVRRADLNAWLAANRSVKRQTQTNDGNMTPAQRAILRARESGALRVVGGSR